MKLRTKAILSIILVVLIIAVCSFLFFSRQMDGNRRLVNSREKKIAGFFITSMTRRINQQYSIQILDLIHSRKDILKLFAERDVDRLIPAVSDIAHRFGEEDKNFSYFALALPDSSLLLRANNPGAETKNQECGSWDMIDHSRNFNLKDGIGFDCNGLNYRLAYPVSYQGKDIGIVVVVVGIEPFIDELRQSLGLHTALLLNNLQADYPKAPGINMISTRRGMIFSSHDSLWSRFAQDIDIDGDNKILEIDGSFFHSFTSLAVHDSHNREIGHLLHSLDVTALVSRFRSTQHWLIVFTIVLLALSGMVLYFSFRIILSRFVDLNKRLEQRNAALSEHEQTLEIKVRERTAELEEMNNHLQKEITKRQDSSLSLQEAVQTWQSTFDAITDPVTILDEDLNIVIVNQAARQMLGQDDKKIIGHFCYQLFAGRTSSCRSCPVKKGPLYGQSHQQEVEHRHIGKTLLVTCDPIIDHGEILGFVHTARDITQEKNLKKQLVQAQKMEAIATLAGGIAHDFNNILGAILGNADLLLYRIPSHSLENNEPEGNAAITFQEIRVNLEAIKKAGNRARDLVSQILAFSRQTKTQRRNVVITPMIKEAVKLLRSSLPANIEIDFNIDQNIDRIYADLTQIHQVFMNLCTNAAQAMKEHGGRLVVSLRQVADGSPEMKSVPDLKPGRYVAVSVEDTGHGMSQEVMERIFDPFFTTRDVDEGSGLGLSVLHGIITAHEGVLDVQSKEGEGSCFTVFFPCVAAGDERIEDVVTGLPKGNEKVLFVDDEEDIVRMTTRMLEYLGYKVCFASSGDQALAMISGTATDIDLLITDYSMPVMTGLQLAEKARRICPNLPIILCSGFNESVFSDEIGGDAVDRFLSKPLDMKGLAVAIREILANG